MRIRNKSKLWFHPFKLAPGAECDVQDFEGDKAIKDAPWILEKVVGVRDKDDRGRASAREATASRQSESPPPASPMAHEQAPADPHKRKPGRPRKDSW